MAATSSIDVSVAIPTYGRERALVDTVTLVLAQQPAPMEILVLDQTARHEPATEECLTRWNEERRIRWFRLGEPAIPRAMNRALLEARGSVVLYLDDDVVPGEGLVGAHEAGYGAEPDAWAVAGQVVQPWQKVGSAKAACTAEGLRQDLEFPFNSTARCWVRSSVGCNLSVRRSRALEIGGFDENFRGAAFRFETEFCRRVWQRGGKVFFAPDASVRHLRLPAGGTRAHGSHLRSASPSHGVGDYYFAMRCGRGWEKAAYVFRRPIREIATRFHLTHPWWIPVKLLGEMRAMAMAWHLNRQGPKLIGQDRWSAECA